MSVMEVRSHMLYVDGKRVEYKATPNTGGSLSPEGIVLHDTAGDLRGTGSVSWLTNRDARASAHMVIGRGANGVLVQLAPFNVVTWHAGVSSYEGRGQCNNFTIGLEIANPGRLVPHGEGRYRNGTPDKPGVVVSTSDGRIEQRTTKEHGAGHWMDYTPEQVENVKHICSALKAAYPGIKFITTHWFIAPGRKVDTNPLFPLDEVRAQVLGVPMPTPRPEVPVPTPTPKPPLTGAEQTGNTTALSLNFRRAPNGPIIGTLPKGTEVKIKGREGDWLQVTSPRGYLGYVHSKYVTINN